MKSLFTRGCYLVGLAWLCGYYYWYHPVVPVVAFPVTLRPCVARPRPAPPHPTCGVVTVKPKPLLLTSTPSTPSQDADDQDEELPSSVSAPPVVTHNNRLDDILAYATLAFPLFVVSAAVVGYTCPASLSWVNRDNLISWLLAAVMTGTGLTLSPADFAAVRQQWKFVPVGTAAQFTIMPLTAWVVGKALLLQSSHSDVATSLFLGLLLVGCSPGGTASNLVSMIAGADVALSVVLTSCSTFLAVVATPALVQWLAGTTSSSIAVSGWTLMLATAKVVLGPVLLGMGLNQKAPRLARWLSRFTPLASVLIVALICGGVVSSNADLMKNAVVGPAVITAVLVLHTLGFALGYLLPRWWAGASIKTARTVSIEVGMQNSALAVVLAQSMGASPLAALPGALSATAHSCLGSLLAAVWRVSGGTPDPATIDQESSTTPETCVV